MLQLVTGLLQIDLGLLELADVGGGDIVAVHLDRRFDLRIKIDDLHFEPIFAFSQKFFGSHHLGDRIIKIGNAVTRAAEWLDRQLGKDPLHMGIPGTSSVHRVAFRTPLEIEYEVIEDGKKVIVRGVFGAS